MTFTPWATTDAFYETWFAGDPIANDASLLRSATLLVARATGDNPYNPGLVVDDARRDAVLAQAAAWANAGIDPAAGTAGLKGVAKAKAIASGSITYDTPTVADRAAALSQLAPDAWNILYAAGLLTTDYPLPQWSADPAPGVYVGELGYVQGVALGPNAAGAYSPLSTSPWGWIGGHPGA